MWKETPNLYSPLPLHHKINFHLFEPSPLLSKFKTMYFRPHATNSIEPSPLLSKSEVMHWHFHANISKIPQCMIQKQKPETQNAALHSLGLTKEAKKTYREDIQLKSRLLNLFLTRKIFFLNAKKKKIIIRRKKIQVQMNRN